MARILHRSMTAALALAVALALAFGTSQAVLADQHCPNDGWNTLGACVDHNDCVNKCDQVHGTNYVAADCMDGCCHCIL